MTRTSFCAAAAVAISVLGAWSAVPAHAASLIICDAEACGSADPNIKFSAAQFEGGFVVNGNLVEFGPGTGSVSVSDVGLFVDGATQTRFFGLYRAFATRASFSASTISRISNRINSRSSGSGSWGALSTWWFARACCTTCPTRTTVFARSATSCG